MPNRQQAIIWTKNDLICWCIYAALGENGLKDPVKCNYKEICCISLAIYWFFTKETSRYLNQCWFIVNWTLRNKLQSNLNKNSNIFIEENAFGNVLRKTAAILSQPQCVEYNDQDRGFMCFSSMIENYHNSVCQTCYCHKKRKNKTGWDGSIFL